MDQSAAALALAIGARVRQERQSRRWTLDQLADAAGVRLGQVRSITEVSANPPGPLGADRAAAAPQVPIEPGTQELTVMVEVVYAIDQ